MRSLRLPALAVLALAARAPAEIMYTHPIGLRFTIDQPLSLDLDGNNAPDLRFSANVIDPDLRQWFPWFIGENGARFAGVESYEVPTGATQPTSFELVLGQSIAGGLPAELDPEHGAWLPEGQPAGDDRTFVMGLQVPDTALNPHYAWLRLSLGSVDLLADNFVDVVDFAYETTPDTPIPAGAVPAPASLGLLALGGLLAARRRRC